MYKKICRSKYNQSRIYVTEGLSITVDEVIEAVGGVELLNCIDTHEVVEWFSKIENNLLLANLTKVILERMPMENVLELLDRGHLVKILSKFTSEG